MDDDAHSADEWPLPPPWMWGCQKCTDLYKAMKHVLEVLDEAHRRGKPDADYDFMDSAVASQIRLAQHIATGHPGDLPAYDHACTTCMFYESRVTNESLSQRTREGSGALGLEHRARHLFAPPSIAGSM
ncbi:hypothetical protein [Streptomyces sp. NPDC001985]|uniref:hypothetical protein n=1 Tax=Streptomyces sp. NPDC001985 TaxID=3154406 RepID=UPI00332EF9CD